MMNIIKVGVILLFLVNKQWMQLPPNQDIDDVGSGCPHIIKTQLNTPLIFPHGSIWSGTGSSFANVLSNVGLSGSMFSVFYSMYNFDEGGNLKVFTPDKTPRIFMYGIGR